MVRYLQNKYKSTEVLFEEAKRIKAFRFVSIDFLIHPMPCRLQLPWKVWPLHSVYWVPMNFSCTQGCSLADCSIGCYIWDCHEQDFLACAGAWILSRMFPYVSRCFSQPQLACSVLNSSKEKHQAERKSDQPQTIDLQSVGSSMSLRSFARLGASLSVLDFVHLGSSLSVRSFCRLGSSISVYGCARISSTFSVLDFGDTSCSLSLRSFSQLAAEQTTVTLYSSTISSVNLQPFMKRGAQVSLSSFSRLGSTPFPNDIHQIASSLSMASNELHLALCHHGSSLMK